MLGSSPIPTALVPTRASRQGLRDLPRRTSKQTRAPGSLLEPAILFLHIESGVSIFPKEERDDDYIQAEHGNVHDQEGHIGDLDP